ncbi:DUF1707 SHOCT-like domain-containing protein [Nocardiopsis trehalosi]|uniref:DUF1707 SHOCT-like domain-containing protein n=1 Tax=Nocardiopsis trehalosi TaxID=109329 RepID=UPI000AD6B599|nr:DUF1707 domain-containing protein [Nocardiopsis trehalosi]
MDTRPSGTGPEDDGLRMRAADRDRDDVAEILRDAAAEGRITLEELDERLDRVYRARTYADLRPITADLPVPGPAGPPAPAAPPGPAAAPLVLRTAAGTIARRGVWHVPQRVEAVNPYGTIRLDFREAVLSSQVTEVHVSGAWGETRIILPDGATAEMDVDTSWFGSADSRVPAVPAPPAPHFRITGGVKGGSLRVRYRMRLEDWLGGSAHPADPHHPGPGTPWPGHPGPGHTWPGRP